jgi:subtilisin family serine protease|tara:strand:+ start:25582 stop:26568 length:987 start_codon:yes stop_codon:yes gene_type:complete
MPDIQLPHYEVNLIGTLNQLSDHIGWGLRDLQIPSHWAETRGEGVTVMVIDSGLADHSDLGDNEDSKLSKSFIKESVKDVQGHGTHVSGIIAAKNNAVGVVGVAPNAKIISVKALNKYGKTNDIILKEALEYAVKIKPDIINLSLGSFSPQPQLESLYKKLTYELNIPIVCAAGNFGNKGVMYPAKYPFTISVGSYKKDHKLSDFSAFSKEKFVDFVAPGDEILSTYLKDEYAVMSGTSMAAPFLAGIMALLISKYKKNGQSYTVEELRSVLQSASIDVGAKGKDNKFGYGIINVERALREIDGYGLSAEIKKDPWWKRLKEHLKFNC